MQKQNRSKRHPQAGFSLAEMMVVIVIIGLLATMVVPNVISRLGAAKKTVAKQDIIALDGALENYRMDEGRYPDSLEVLIEKDENGNSYLKRVTLPKDPWGAEYQYEPPSSGQGLRIFTLGADGIPGGEGNDADMDQVTIRG